MEIAKVTDKGQITIPHLIRKDLGLEPGKKIAFVKTNDGYLIVDPYMAELVESAKGFKGLAEELNLRTMDDVVALVKKTRREIF
ncbi:AbrB family transcriptional regulator [Bacilli bacterium]|nr:AbrB family transcriptional regulator [Bacilli bacterium]